MNTNSSLSSSPTETVRYEARLHWIIFLWPTMLILLVAFVQYYHLNIPLEQYFEALLLLIALLWGAHRILLYCFSSLCVTDSFVTIQNGILIRQTLKVSLSQLESIDIKQTILGSILNYGSLVVRGTGGTTAFFSPIAHPLTCRRYIETHK